jgi:hypothetical protein
MRPETTAPQRKFNGFNVMGWPAFPLGANAHFVKHATPAGPWIALRHWQYDIQTKPYAMSHKGFYQYNWTSADVTLN